MIVQTVNTNTELTIVKAPFEGGVVVGIAVVVVVVTDVGVGTISCSPSPQISTESIQELYTATSV